MIKQIYLLDSYLEQTKGWPKYSVMSPFVIRAKELIATNSSYKDFKFTPSGMGRTRIGEELVKGKSPLKFYNSSNSTASQALKRELLIREFWNQVPEQKDRRPKTSWYDGPKSEARLLAWKAGETGHLLVDAGMTQLATEGWMPNRVRMVCASFFSKNLRLWWLNGEAVFKAKLIDYNPASNLENWRWVSATGYNTRLTDVMSPDIQLKKFDPDLAYCRSVLGNTLVPIGLKASQVAKEPSLYKVPQIVTYGESKKTYLNSLSSTLVP
jgi:deoxyribodipyrimidine photolyase